MRRSGCLSFWLALAVAALARPAAAGQRVDVTKLGLTFTLPDGFEAPASAGDGAPSRMAFQRGQPGVASFAVFELVPMAGTIGPGKLDRKIVEDSARAALRGASAVVSDFDYRTVRWKTFELELVVAHVSKGNQRLVTLTTQVPLAHQAVEANLVGPAADEARLFGELQSILASLEGESSWLTDAERSARLGRLVGLLVGMALVLGASVVLRRKRAARGSR
jgi:hypothetical protein